MNNPYKKMDKQLKETQNKYKNVQTEFEDTLQDVLDELNTLNSQVIPTSTQNRLKRKYERYRGFDLFVSSFIAYLITKKRITLEEIAEAEILMAVDKLYKQYDDINKSVFHEYVKDGYENCLEDIKKKRVKTNLEKIVDKQLKSTANGSTYKSYMSGRIISDTQQIKKQAMITMNQNKTLYIKDFSKILERQNKQMLKTKDNKFSGFMEYQAEVMYNAGYKQACIDYGIEEVIFKGIKDERQTKMCGSLDGQKFKVKGDNTFRRYFDSEGGIKEITVKGLEQGINLPPILDFFHYCRSYIVAIPKRKR